jgi:ABC-type transport system involved in multi-copper enzyme maturation permease subunit
VPYYTFDEDNKMYRDVATQFSLLAALAIMVFSASKVVDEEIENRTMLTLMSKPISRWEVLVGKYIGIVCVLFLVIGTMAVLTPNASYLHWLDDKRIDLNIASNLAERQQLTLECLKNNLALAPLFALQFMEVATLAAIAVAISTRYALAVNVTVIAVIYMAANLAAFIPITWTRGPGGLFVTLLTRVLPNLSNFDISQRLVYGDFQLLQSESLRFTVYPAPTYGQIWAYTAETGVYALFYIGASLALAMVLFRTRELT